MILDLLGAIGGGLQNPTDARHRPIVDLLERVMLRGGMLDELTALACAWSQTVCYYA